MHTNGIQFHSCAFVSFVAPPDFGFRHSDFGIRNSDFPRARPVPHYNPSMHPFAPTGEVAWRPTPEIIAASNLRRFMAAHAIPSLEELHRRSTTDIAWFWDAVLKDLGIQFHTPYSQVVDLSQGIACPRWCVGGEMNIVHNLLDKYESTPTADKPAIKWEGEDGTTRTLTYRALNHEVNKAARALQSLGIGPGDAVGVFMPMVPEIVIAMLAIIKVGGIFLPLFSGYGAAAIAQRLADAEAKALFTADGFRRRGKVSRMKPVADEAAAAVHTLQHMIVLEYAGDTNPPWNRERDHWWHELIAGAVPQAPTAVTGADDPMMILYTSGTTGKPKGAVHTHCGFPIKAAQDMLHGMDLHPDETLYWIADMGWMMGPWLVFGTLLAGATMMLYDGAMDYPSPSRLWEMVERHRVTTLGISPTLVRLLLQHGEAPVRKCDLSSLRKFASTGEPWNPEPWRWLFETVGNKKLPILNYSGGTEISGGILCGNILSLLKPCAFAGPLPGMAADVVDESGNPVRGAVGELIIRQPWIGMTRGFWKDLERYLQTYWSHFENVWAHGDWAAIDSDGLWYILGRSDDTIKIAGKRLGPAEVESILVAHPAVGEAAAIGVPDDLKGQALVCFCVLRTGHSPGDSLRKELSARIIHELGKPLAPRAIRFVNELPKTRNGKIMRRLIRAAHLNENPGDVSSLENPAAMEAVREAK
ncbi:MAG: AMP-dependent synthetase [Phycisphaerales bacterium]|nr:AMP-dependent synthetase [Phycisphaerales bacterium]